MSASSSSRSDRQHLFNLLKENSFFREKIILSSGKESDYYLDARRVTLTSDGAYLSARIILDMLAGESYDAIGGPTLGADPILGAIGVLCRQDGAPINTFIVRKAPKAHGKQQQIEGPLLQPGSRVILIDDVATTGKAFVESIDVLARHRVTPVKAVCLVDRGEGAREALAAKGCELVAVFDIQEFLKS